MYDKPWLWIPYIFLLRHKHRVVLQDLHYPSILLFGDEQADLHTLRWLKQPVSWHFSFWQVQGNYAFPLHPLSRFEWVFSDSQLGWLVMQSGGCNPGFPVHE